MIFFGQPTPVQKPEFVVFPRKGAESFVFKGLFAWFRV